MKRVIPILMVLAMAGAVYANGLGGQRLEKLVGDQIVDIGTDQDTTPVAGEPIQFDFNLLKSDTRDPLTNTNVTVNIEHKGKTMVNCDLMMEPPLTLLVYTFPEGGDYILKTTFYDKDNVLATTAFPLTIAQSSILTKLLYLVVFLVIILLGIVVGYRIARRRGPSAPPPTAI